MEWKWKKNDWYNENGEPLSSWTKERWDKLLPDEQQAVLSFHLGRHIDLQQYLQPNGSYYFPFEFTE